MKIISGRNSFSIFWEIINNELVRIPLENFNTHALFQSGPSFKADLPWEIVLYILKRTFKIRFQTRNFEDAFEICLINKDMAKVIYQQIYGTDPVKVLEMIRRLNKTFCILETVYDNYITCPNMSGDTKIGIRLTRDPSKMNHTQHYPWEFQHEVELCNIDLENNDTHVFGGGYHGDTVWIHGTELSNGMFDAHKFHNPNIILILADYTNTLIPTTNSLGFYWKRLSLLMRICYGKHTAVYFMVKPNGNRMNPFIEVTDTLILL